MIEKLKVKGLKGLEFSDAYNGRVVLITGANGTGKTARLDAIRLLLSGKLPGYGERPSEILLASSQAELLVEAEMSGAPLKHIRRHYRLNEDGKATQGISVYPTPLTNRTTELDAFIQTKCSEALAVLDAEAFLEIQTEVNLKRFLSSFIADPTAFELLDAEEDENKRQMSEKRKEKKEKEAALAELSRVTATPSALPQQIEERLAELRKQKEELTKELLLSQERKKQLALLHSEVERLKSYLETCDRQLSESQTEREKWEAQSEKLSRLLRKIKAAGFESKEALQFRIEQLYVEIKSAENLMKSFQTLIERFRKANIKPDCENCELKSYFQEIAEKYKTAEAEVNAKSKRLAELAALQSEFTDKPSLELVAEKIEGCKQFITSILKAREESQMALQKVDARIRELGSIVPSTDTEALLSKIQGEIKELELSLKTAYDFSIKKSQLVKVQLAYETIEAEIEKLKKEAERIAFKREMLLASVEKELAETCKELSNLYNGSLKFRFLSLGGRRDFELGISRGDKFIGYRGLSSSQKAAFAVSIIAAYLKRKEAPFRLILIDNAEKFDKENFPHFIEACKELTKSGLVHQIFIATSRYENEVDGIQVLSLGVMK